MSLIKRCALCGAHFITYDEEKTDIPGIPLINKIRKGQDGPTHYICKRCGGCLGACTAVINDAISAGRPIQEVTENGRPE